nr:hypothetical protein CFP56_00672 [Quercus suber]
MHRARRRLSDPPYLYMALEVQGESLIIANRRIAVFVDRLSATPYSHGRAIASARCRLRSLGGVVTIQSLCPRNLNSLKFFGQPRTALRPIGIRGPGRKPDHCQQKDRSVCGPPFRDTILTWSRHRQCSLQAAELRWSCHGLEGHFDLTERTSTALRPKIFTVHVQSLPSLIARTAQGPMRRKASRACSVSTWTDLSGRKTARLSKTGPNKKATKMTEQSGEKNPKDSLPHTCQRKGQHGYTTDSRPVLGAIDSNVRSIKLPISPTALEKPKPKAYAFIEGRPDEDEKLKVQVEKVSGLNPTTAKLQSVLPKIAISSAPDAVEQPPMPKNSPATSRESQLPHANTFPSTPSMRLPLADLIGNLDERPTFPESETHSPEDLLTWIPNSSSEFFTPNRRKRKRARSSSPSCPSNSSQRQAASTYLPSIITTQSYGRTSDADPAADLWQRYAGGRTAENGLQLPEFHSHQFQASPRSLETPMKSGGLRRWASTGNEWPSAGSKRKRRRREPKLDIGLWQDQQQKSMSGKSKVAVLVEKIQESLASQNLARSAIETPRQNPAPSTSSPVLQVEAPMGQASSASRPRLGTPPLERFVETTEEALAPSIALHSSPQALLSHAKPSITQQERLFQDPFVFAPLKLQSKAPLPAFKRPSINRANSGGGRVYPTAQTVEPIPEVLEVDKDLDEFGDDFELSAEDLRELVPQPLVQLKSPCDISSRPNAVPEPINIFVHGNVRTMDTVQKAQISNEYEMSDDDNTDEFGCNDIDEDSFAQAEISATQAYMASHPSSNGAHAKFR